MAQPGLAASDLTALMLLQVAVILVAARVVGGLAERIGQPRVVGEIVAGILLGPTVLGWGVDPTAAPWTWLACDRSLAGLDATATACLFPPATTPALQAIGQLGLALYMFLVGMDLDLGSLRDRAGAAAGVAVGSIVGPLLAAAAITPLLYREGIVAAWGSPEQPTALVLALMVGAMLTVTAFPVMVRILQERDMAATDLGRVGVGAAALATILMFLVVSVARTFAEGASMASLATRLLLSVLYVAVMVGPVRSQLVVLGRSYQESLERAAGNDPEGWARRRTGVGHGLTTGMFALMLLALVLSSLTAHLLGLSVIIGGFLAGVAMPTHTELSRDLTDETYDLTAVLLLPVFLALSGLRTDFTQLHWAIVPAIGIFLVAGIISKWGGVVVAGRLARLGGRDSNAIAWLMNCRGLLILVVALIGVDAGVITPGMQAGAVLMALVTTAMTGPMFDVAVRRGQREG